MAGRFKRPLLVITCRRFILLMRAAVPQKLEAQCICDESIEQLLVGFADILRSMRPVKELSHSDDLKKTITNMLKLIQDASQFIIEYKPKSKYHDCLL